MNLTRVNLNKLMFIYSQQTFVLMKTSWRRLSSPSSADVFRLRLQKTSWSRLQDVLIKTNMFVLALHLQKTSSRRLRQHQYVRLGHMSSRRLQDVFKTSPKCLAKTSSRRFEDVFKTSSNPLQGVFKTSSRRFQGVPSS